MFDHREKRKTSHDLFYGGIGEHENVSDRTSFSIEAMQREAVLGNLGYGEWIIHPSIAK